MKTDALRNTPLPDNLKESSATKAPKVVNKQQETVSPRVQAHTHNHSAAYILSQIAHRYAVAGNTREGNLTIEQRAARRERINAARKQQNLENIMQQALSYVDEREPNEEVDPDWLFQFFEMAESIFSQPMQRLWGKILAMQTLRPGSFSLRSLSTLKQMTHREAIVFQSACAILVRDKQEYGARILTGCYALPVWFGLLHPRKSKNVNLSKFGLSYPDLLSLIDLNLIYASEIESSMEAGQIIELEGGAKRLRLSVKTGGQVLTYYKLTQSGNELSRLIACELNAAYVEQLAATLAPAFELS
ncbi:TIGR03899 family protein [Catenovulum sediminis]|uniref:TIGR03899 family protein n=1 Tax=Catenovulum sediminis TaxID=1740262 RepID=UPI0011811426|nr:TIGR03899 family protein [Catenovulum sediminis]